MKLKFNVNKFHGKKKKIKQCSLIEINCKGKGYHTWSYCKESNTLRNYILLCA